MTKHTVAFNKPLGYLCGSATEIGEEESSTMQLYFAVRLNNAAIYPPSSPPQEGFVIPDEGAPQEEQEEY